MDREDTIVGEHENNHLEHVAGQIRPDRELFRRVAVRFEVNDDESVIRGVTNRDVGDTVPSGCLMDLHTPLA